ncbi:MAG: nucleotidyl transferase AbiEii/AbiGii toxin family protein [Archangium sp.]|nr:nucleotidyl transferase AbiEii/AbiGii toxin family protein [Archangium sp.]
MTRPLKNLEKSVHTRLLNIAKKTNRPFIQVLQLYAMERFLYRLAQSKHSKEFVLKGGLMLRVWKAPVTRPTKDVDLLGRTKNTTRNLVLIVQDVCRHEVEADGMQFDPSTAVGSLINEDAEYNGVRVKFTALLGVARVTMQLDVGFGDAVVPGPVEVEIPPLLDFPAPRMRGYQRETTIAEKFHAMVELGTINGRMKDFYDIWLLAQNFEFDGATLAEAIKATFGTRTTLVDLEPIALTPGFAEGEVAQQRWTAFLRKSDLTDAPLRFAETTRIIRSFVLPALQPQHTARWKRGGPWK